MSVKEAAIEAIRKLPDDLAIEDFVYELYVRMKIEEGLRQADEGKTIDNEEFKKRNSRWLD